MKTINDGMTAMYFDRAVPIEQLGTVEANIYQIRGDVYKFALIPESRDKTEQEITALKANVKKQMDAYRATSLLQSEKDGLALFDPGWVTYQAEIDKCLSLVKAGQQDEMLKMVADGGSTALARTAVDNAANTLSQINVKAAEELNTAGDKQFASSSMIIIVVAIIAVIFALLIAIVLTRLITGPINKVKAGLKKIAVGDVSEVVNVKSKDEIGQMAETYADMQKYLVEMAGVTQKIAAGDLSVTVNVRSDKDVLGQSCSKVATNLKALVADANMLSMAAVEGKLATRADASKHQGEYAAIVKGVNQTLDSVIGPLNVAAEYVDKISKGNIPARITDNYNGDFNNIKNNLNQCIDAVNNLVADANLLSKAAVEGKLATRADASKHFGDYAAIVKGVNLTLDSVIGPLNVAADYVDKISKGNIPARITDNYNGDFNTIKNNLNQCIDAVNNLVADANVLSKAAVEGKLATRADASKHNGDFRKIVAGVNQTLDSVIGPLNVAADYVDKISKGNIPAKISDTYNGDFNVIKNNLNQCIDAVNNLVADAGMLAKAAVEGKLSTRADASKHYGDYAAIVKGVNQTLDSVIGPLNVAAEYVDKISKGNIPAKISDTYNGDFNTIKNNLNQCIDAVNNLVADANVLSKAAVEGKLATRADASKHNGDFRKIVAGVNQTLDSVIGPLNVAADYVDKISKGNIPAKISDTYNGDFNTIKNNLNQCIDAVNNLVADAGMLAKAAVEGKLATRADASKHNGDFRKIVAGVNQTLDSVIGPLNVAADYVDKISKGNIPAKISDTYNGDFNIIKNNLNQCIDAVNNLVADAGMLSQAAVEGKLATRADASKHFGDYAAIVKGVNGTLDSVIGPLNVAADYVEKISRGAIPAKITDKYNGDFNTIKNNLNQCIDAVNNLVADANMLSKAAVEGKLATRADASKHQGDFAAIVKGVNETLDAVIKPVNEAAAVLERLAANDLTMRVTGDYKGDHAKIKDSVNLAIDNLSKLVLALKQSATQLSTSSGQLTVASNQTSVATQQVATSSQQMAKGAQDQSANSQQTAKSVDQLSTVINQIAKSAQEQSNGVQKAVASITEVSTAAERANAGAKLAAQSSKDAAEAAKLGAEKARQTLKGMEKIKVASQNTALKIEELGTRSTEIGKIVAVIDDIAAQTNLLALNAAIEAARAGDQGRGFAVVSDEVRKLAERTATATKEIAELIANVQKGVEQANQVMAGGSLAVEEGFGLATQAGEALQQIMKSATEVDSQIDQISTSARQVSTTVGELVKIIDNVGSVTEQNTAATEEMSATATEVSKSVETVAGIAEENSAATEQVSASAEEMSAQVEEIVASSQSLQEMSVELQKMIDSFKLSDNAKLG